MGEAVGADVPTEVDPGVEVVDVEDEIGVRDVYCFCVDLAARAQEGEV